ncbi:autoinducer 2 (AI-2) ABC transport system, membrane channel protein LsrD [Geomicrobium sp. JCM 19039]|nr:autoinducer 2 (AI-2) ABC transport system, membrane channel protein LsrD [Geomicrobium sp. JCM 19039]
MNGVDLWLAVFLTLFICSIAGLLNGMIVALIKVQALVVTLGTMFLYSGIALVLSGHASTSGYEGISGFPDAFVQIANGITFGIPNQLYFIAASFVVFGFLLHYTKYGRHVFLVGINKQAAIYSGIKSKWTMMSTYMIAGLGGGISGVILTSYFSSARSDLGSDAILPVITAVVLGGTSILGGRGTVLGTMLASLIVGFMNYGLQMSGMSGEQTTLIVGFILVLAVFMRQSNLHKLYRRKKEKIEGEIR